MRTIAGAIVAAVAWLTLSWMWRHCACPLTARSLAQPNGLNRNAVPSPAETH
jgi:hypothetical protein